MLLADEREKGVLDIKLDYSVPAYRDCSVGAFLYARLSARGIHTLRYAEKESDTHAAYLTKMGFVRKKDVYTKKI